MPDTRASVDHSWATLEIRAVDPDKRRIEGIASTPSLDRTDWIIEPLGMEFRNPVPLLWQHRAAEPVGIVRLDKPTKAGITFSASLPNIEEPGRLKDRVDEAWQSIKAGLVRGISIGFKAIEKSFRDDGGIRFIRTEIFELSLVTVPANAEATITQIRSLDCASLAAPGTGDAQDRPGAAGTAQPKPRTTKMPVTLKEQIASYTAMRDTAKEKRKAIMAKATEAGTTLDEAESQEYDGLAGEIRKLDVHIARLVDEEAESRQVVQEVNGSTPEAASQSRAVIPMHQLACPVPEQSATIIPFQHATQVQRIHMRRQVPTWVPFVRMVCALAANRGDWNAAARYARGLPQWRSETPEVEQVLSADLNWVLRAPVPPGGTGVVGDATWAGPLVVAQNLASEFAEFLRPLTVLGRIPGLRRVPFNISLPRATAGMTVGWVGEGAPKPVTQGALETITMRWAKAAAIVVLTEELVRFSNPSAEAYVRDELSRAMTFFLDRQFTDPSVAAVANVSPASITNGVTAVVPSGTNMAAFRTDVAALFQKFADANIPTTGGVWIMTQMQALRLSLAQNSLGQNVFPNISPDTGGTLMGYPVVQSENIVSSTGSPTEGYPIIFLIAPEVMLADDGQINIDASREASVQMESAPDSPPTASTNLVSLWQTNMIGLRAERFINWLKRRTQAVQYITSAKYAE
jgi:HK97 family phage prohead protease